MRPAVNLIARHLEDAVILIGQEQPFDFATALGIDPFADQGWRRILTQIEGPDRAGRAWDRTGHDARPGRLAGHTPDHGLQVLEGRPTASTNDVDPEVLDEFGECFGQALWIER